MVLDTKGHGVIIGSGIYQVGNKTKFRGFDTNIKLLDMIDIKSNKIEVVKRRPLSWREVAFHNWAASDINHFLNIKKNVNINFDKKRIWIDDYKNFKEIKNRKVYSTPIPYFHFLNA